MAEPRVRIATLHADLRARLAALRVDCGAVLASRQMLERTLGDGRAYYGVNTGFGVLASERVEGDQLGRLQTNLLLSHAVGLGPLVPKPISRLMLQLKIHALGLGFSGVSEPVFKRLLEFAERDLVPAVPSKGSLGASGDLAPLAHLALPLVGRGRFWDQAGEGTSEAAVVLREQGLEPVALAPKDGLALINGTQLMAAYGAHVLHATQALLRNADVLAALSLEALRGSIEPFDVRLHDLRPHPGQGDVASNVRVLMSDSEILESHHDCGRVQDPYSLRCVPQVHGASRDALAYARDVIECELSSVTDNPIVLAEGEVLSGGNFHGQPLALALDHTALALAELASISERRTYLLLAGQDGLPKLLMTDTGVNSGFMIPQYTAAALVSHNKVLCHPASADSIPSCLGQEDHVSMGGISAIKALEVFENVEQVLAIEALTAAQALDYRKPLRAGRGVEAAHACLRAAMPHKEADALFGEDISTCVGLLREGTLLARVEQAVGALR